MIIEQNSSDQNANLPQVWWPRLITITVWSLVAGITGMLLWALPRGFDITDEGFYLLNYRYPGEYEASFTDFHLLVAQLFGLVDKQIVTYRLIGLLGQILGAGTFGLSLAAWLRQALPQGPRRWLTQPSLVVGCVLVGQWLAISIMPRTISYNGLNTLFLLLSTAAVLRTLAHGPAGSAWLVIAGFAIGLDVFVKVSTAILLLGSLLLLLAWCWRRAGLPAGLRALVWLVVGLTIGMELYFLRVQPATVWWHTFNQEMTMLRGQGYGTSDLLAKYFSSALKVFSTLVWPLGPVLLGVPALVWWWLKSRAAGLATSQTNWVALVGLGSCALWLAVQAKRHVWYSTSYLNKFDTLAVLLAMLLLAAALVALEAGASLPKVQDKALDCTIPLASQRWQVGLWLSLLPFLAAAGTYNDLRINLVMDAAPWFGLLILVLAIPRPVCLPVWVMPLLLLLPIGLAAEQTVWGTLRVPYCQSGPATTQDTQLVMAGVHGSLLLDASTVAGLHRLDNVLVQAGFRAGDPLLAFHDMPGLVYLLGGVSPGAPWYFSGIDERNCHAMQISRQPLTRAYVLLSDSMTTYTKACMRNCGLHFPDNYKLVGIVPHPYVHNTYLYRQNQDSIRVYAPILNP